MDFEREVTELLSSALPGCQIFIHDTSHEHAHGGPRAQTHFTLIVISTLFVGKTLLQRHRMIQEIIKTPLSHVKALHLHTRTPEEWDLQKDTAIHAPGCRGG